MQEDTAGAPRRPRRAPLVEIGLGDKSRGEDAGVTTPVDRLVAESCFHCEVDEAAKKVDSRQHPRKKATLARRCRPICNRKAHCRRNQ